MRMLYLTLALFILLGIGAACRTPPLVPADCEALPSGSIGCPPAADRRHG